MEQELEIPLTGGRITEGVVRVGDAVRRPVGPHSPFVHRLLKHLEDVGFDAAPRLLGTDAKGREILDFQHGENRTDFPGISESYFRADMPVSHGRGNRPAGATDNDMGGRAAGCARSVCAAISATGARVAS
ncbi:hypothetical protein ACFYRZ_46055, partial [Streptomyces avermitilis]